MTLLARLRGRARKIPAPPQRASKYELSDVERMFVVKALREHGSWRPADCLQADLLADRLEQEQW